jgi:hypothetical protein
MFSWVPKDANVTDFSVLSRHNNMKSPRQNSTEMPMVTTQTECLCPVSDKMHFRVKEFTIMKIYRVVFWGMAPRSRAGDIHLHDYSVLYLY